MNVNDLKGKRITLKTQCTIDVDSTDIVFDFIELNKTTEITESMLLEHIFKHEVVTLSDFEDLMSLTIE